MILYTGWLSTSHQSLNGQLWLTSAVTQTAFGYIGLGVLAIAIMMGIFTGLNGFLMSSSRLLFSMGRSGIMPTMFSKLHSKYKTPYVAIILSRSVVNCTLARKNCIDLDLYVIYWCIHCLSHYMFVCSEIIQL